MQITKNILIFFMSDLKKGSVQHPFYDNEEDVDKSNSLGFSTQTNETGIAYLKNKIQSSTDGEKLDAVFPFVTKKAGGEDFQGGFRTNILKNGEEPNTSNVANALDWLTIKNDYWQNIVFEPIYFDENATAKESLRYLADMMATITQYAADIRKQHVKDEVKFKVHVDFTGGFRHAAVLMVALVRMLQFANMEMGKVIYTNPKNLVTNRNSENDSNKKPEPTNTPSANNSDKKPKTASTEEQPKKETYFMVEDAFDIMDIYNLIGGAEEFTRYGSVKLLKDYFSNKEQSEGMKNILKAMDGFAEKLKICTSKEAMFESLLDLRKAFDNYSPSDSTYEIFFNCLLPIIKDTYKDILDGCTVLKDGSYSYKADVFALIYWAADKGFLQQALTYYTEWVPKFLEENEWLVPSSHLKDECQKIDMSDNAWYDYLFTAYNQWNPKLVVKRITNTALYSMLNSRLYKFQHQYNFKFQNVILTSIDSYSIWKSIENNPENLPCIKTIQALEKEIQDITKACDIDNELECCGRIDNYYKSTVHCASKSIFKEIFSQAYENYKDYKKYKINSKDTLRDCSSFIKYLYGQASWNHKFSRAIFMEKLLLLVNLAEDKNGERLLTRILDMPPDEGKGIERGDMFRSLLNISTDSKLASKFNSIQIPVNKPLKAVDLCEIASNYGLYKNVYRNSCAHADFKVDKTNAEICEEIKRGVERFCNKL